MASPLKVAPMVRMMRRVAAALWRRCKCQQEQAELSMTHACGFGDLAVPPGLIIDELRRCLDRTMHLRRRGGFDAASLG